MLCTIVASGMDELGCNTLAAAYGAHVDLRYIAIAVDMRDAAITITSTLI